MTKNPKWNRCDICGKFIPMKDFYFGEAVRRMITPDSYYSAEEFETLCKNHNLKNRQEDIRREWRILRAYHEWMMGRE